MINLFYKHVVCKRYPQTSGTADTNKLFDKHLDLRETGCKDGKGMELAQDCVIAGFRTNGVETSCSGNSKVRRFNWLGIGSSGGLMR
jgi:hypothetical protein